VLAQPNEGLCHLELDNKNEKHKDSRRDLLVRFVPSTVGALFPIDDGRSDTVLANIPKNCTNR
jgi:hypothetical protein